MKFATVCSGIGAPEEAFKELGWTPVWCSEIEPFPCAVLQHRHPDAPNLGNMTKLGAHDTFRRTAFDLLIGGTPCQSFSIAGLRAGLGDARGNLALEFCKIAHAKRPAWVIWENVPGVLSDRGNAFGCFLAGLAGGDAPLRPGPGGWTSAGVVSGPVYGLAWRIVDAQYLGVPQRRERVFVVGYIGGWQRAAQVLLEPEGVRGDPAPSGQARPPVAGALTSRSGGGGGPEGPDAAAAGQLIAHTLRGDGFDASEDGTGRGTPLIAFGSKDSGGDASDVAPTLRAGGHHTSHANSGVPPAVAFQEAQSGMRESDTHATLDANNGSRRRNGVVVPLDMRQASRGATMTNNRKPGSSGGAPEEVCPPLKAQSGQTGKGDAAPVMFSLMPQNSGKDFKAREVEVAQPLMAAGPTTGNQGGDLVLEPVAFVQNSRSEVREFGGDGKTVGAIASTMAPQQQNYLKTGAVVRRLTPRECERLQAFPDDYTSIPIRGGVAADGPRYKALGNSMAVVVIRWIGRRIELVNAAIAAEVK